MDRVPVLGADSGLDFQLENRVTYAYRLLWKLENWKAMAQ